MPHEPRFPEQPDFLGRYVRLLYLKLMDELDAGTAERYPEVTAGMKQVLALLARDGSRLSDLAATAGMTKQALSEHVDGLERLGLLVRYPDPTDGRAKLLKPTREGLASMSFALQVAVQVHERWSQLLGEEKTRRLMSLLSELVSRLSQTPAG